MNKTTLKREPIGKGALPVQSWNPDALSNGDEVEYIDISSIDRDAKTICGTTRITRATAPSRARQVVKADDILVSTVRPNLNAVAIVPDHLEGAIASTGFCVLRCKPNVQDPKYLFHWLRTPQFVSEMERLATGASYPAVSDRIIKESLYPDPGYPDQWRIAGILDKADAIRRKRREAVAFVDDLIQATFLNLVGPGAIDYQSWPIMTIEDLARSEPRSMRTGPFGSDLLHSEFVEAGVAVLGIDNAVLNRFAWDERRYVTEEKYEELKRFTVFPGDVIITIMGTTGRSAVVPDDIPRAITTKHLACITLNRELAEPEFVSNAIHRHPALLGQIGASHRGAIMPGLNLTLIKSLKLHVPPIRIQRHFTKCVRQVRSNEDRLLNAAREADDLFCAITQRAFRGEL